MIISLVLTVRKYLLNIRTDGVPIVNWWYSILSDLYVNISLVCLLDSYDYFTSNIFISWRLWTFLRHILLFIGVYEHSYVTYLHLLMVTNVYFKPFSFLMGTNVSYHLPLFLDGFGCFTLKPFFLDNYECFLSKPLLSWRLRTFLCQKPLLIQQTDFF